MAVRDRVTSPVALALPTPRPGHVVRSIVAPMVARLRAGFDGIRRPNLAAPRHAPPFAPRGGPREGPVAQFPVPSAPLPSGTGAPVRACAFVFIANLPQLMEVYGAEFALHASIEIKYRLLTSFVSVADADLAMLRHDCFLLWSNPAFPVEDAQARQGASARLESLLTGLGGMPVQLRDTRALVQLHVGWSDAPSPGRMSQAEVELRLWAAQPAPDFQLAQTEGWQRLYREDMEVALQVSDALHARRLAIEWHPVVGAPAQAAAFAAPLYHEARFHTEGEPHAAAALRSELFMPCLQRLGLVRTFDHLAAGRVVRQLRLGGTVRLGLSISAQSARRDHWWASLMVLLRREPELAARLVVEIAGEPTLPDLESVRDFCLQLQLCGCRVAIKHFGGDSGNLAAAKVCRPDIIKLDPVFIRRAREDRFGRELLEEMLALCGSFAPSIVVDGIEREEDIRMALDAGAEWLQGCGIPAGAPLHEGTLARGPGGRA